MSDVQSEEQVAKPEEAEETSEAGRTLTHTPYSRRCVYTFFYVMSGCFFPKPFSVQTSGLTKTVVCLCR